MQYLPSFFRSSEKGVSQTESSDKSQWLKWIAIGTISASVCTAFYLSQKMKIKDHPSVPWMIEPHPYLGHIPFVAKNRHRNHEKYADLMNAPTNKSPIICKYIAGYYIHHIASPELVRWIFTTKFDKFKKFTKKDAYVWENLFGKYGDGIFVSDGKEWRFHRKIGSRMFSIRNVRGFMYDCCIETTHKTMHKMQELQGTQDFAIVDINDILGRMTFDCFTSIAFGASFDSMSLYPDIHPFGKAFDSLLSLLTNRYTDIFSSLKRLLNVGYEKRVSECDAIINQFCDEILETRLMKGQAQLSDETGSKSFDLLSLYLTHNPKLTDYQLKKIALNFIIAGRDTTRMLLSWFLFDMCCFPEFKEKIYAEIDALAMDGNINYDNELLPTYHSVSNFANGLQFVECCLCESLRFHPVVPFSGRVAKEDIEIPVHILYPNKSSEELKLIKKCVIRKGEKIILHHPTTSRNKSFFVDPDEYRPERYQSKGVRTFPTHVFTFFNLQPRLCLGRDFALMEAKIFVYHFFKMYDFELVAGQDIISAPGLILNMQNGMKLKISPRRNVLQAET